MVGDLGGMTYGYDLAFQLADYTSMATKYETWIRQWRSSLLWQAQL